MTKETLEQSLNVFGLTDPPTQESLDQRYRELLFTWHPHRYANLTNNPQKYMQMYKKGEAKSKEIQAAYERLTAWLAERDTATPPT